MKRLVLVVVLTLIGAYAGAWAGSVGFELTFPPSISAWRFRDEWREVAIVAGIASGGVVGLALAELIARLRKTG